MEANLRYEIDSCIAELRNIANALETEADEVENSISGMSTRKYTATLRDCARQYRKAAEKLSSVK